jgi:CheY-like chemotaxis protein
MIERVLLVAWKGSAATTWVETLKSGGYTVLLEDTTGERAWRTAKERGIDVVIIDGQKKPSHGRQTGHALRDTAKTRNIPIIWTNLEDEDKVSVNAEVKPDVVLTAPTDAASALSALQALHAQRLSDTSSFSAPPEESEALVLTSESLSVTALPESAATFVEEIRIVETVTVTPEEEPVESISIVEELVAVVEVPAAPEEAEPLQSVPAKGTKARAKKAAPASRAVAKKAVAKKAVAKKAVAKKAVAKKKPAAKAKPVKKVTRKATAAKKATARKPARRE